MQEDRAWVLKPNMHPREGRLGCDRPSRPKMPREIGEKNQKERHHVLRHAMRCIGQGEQEALESTAGSQVGEW